MLSSQDAFVLDSGEVKERPYHVQVRAELVARNPDVTVRVGLLTAEEDAVRIGSRIVGAPVTLERGAADAVAELVNTIAGRLCALLAARGFRLEQSAPTVSVRAALPESSAWEVTVSLQTEDGERFRIDRPGARRNRTAASPNGLREPSLPSPGRIAQGARSSRGASSHLRYSKPVLQRKHQQEATES